MGKYKKKDFPDFANITCFCKAVGYLKSGLTINIQLLFKSERKYFHFAPTLA